MNQTHKDLLIALIVTIVLAIGSIAWYSHVWGALVISKDKKYIIHNIILHIKINGHTGKVEFDTGSDVTSIPISAAKHIGLIKLPPSKILGKYDIAEGIDNKSEKQQAVDVKMSIEGSKTFNTTITIDKSKINPGFLSLSDYMKAFGTLPIH